MFGSKGGTLELWFEFIITLVLLVGGGLLLWYGKSESFVISVIMAAVTFWFTKQNSRKTPSNPAPPTAPPAGDSTIQNPSGGSDGKL